ncbi:MAG: hypothetical protein H0W78_13405 [Planctomycetes bacterium]|nr:hypothetical protein [Planctomycetota bacterium]
MPKSISLFLFLAVCSCLQAADAKIAVVNKYEIEEMLMVRVLAKPENSQAKAAIQAATTKAQAVQQELGNKLNDPTQRDAAMKALTAAHQEKNDVEQSVKIQVQGELIRVIKEATKDRFVIVLDADMVSDSVITKSGDMVDITLDIKEFLLTK